MLLIRITDEGEPVTTAPVSMQFDGWRRIEQFTDHNGEIRVEPCLGSAVHLTINGTDHGVHICHDGMELDIDLSD
jgi:hypothetical protein